MSCLHSSRSTEVPFSKSHGACPLVFNAQANWPVCIWMCWTPTCCSVQVVLSSVSSGTLTTVSGSLIRGNITVHELHCLLNGWNASIKVPSVETGRPLPFLDLALEQRVPDENSRKFGVKFSTFRKTLNIHSYAPGDSDHHPCMMLSTTRGRACSSLANKLLSRQL